MQSYYTSKHALLLANCNSTQLSRLTLTRYLKERMVAAVNQLKESGMLQLSDDGVGVTSLDPGKVRVRGREMHLQLQRPEAAVRTLRPQAFGRSACVCARMCARSFACV